jgi:predicted small secreted protein
MWLALALIAGIAVGVVESDSIAKTVNSTFNVTVKVLEETKDTVIKKTKDLTK